MERTKREYNMSFKLVDDHRDFLQRLKAGEEEEWEILTKMMAPRIKGAKKNTLEWYGREEMNAKGLPEEEVDAIIRAGMWEAVSRYTPDDKLTRNGEYRRLKSYVGLYIVNYVRRAVEVANGVSKYMAANLLYLKKRSIDLWESPEEDIIACLAGCSQCRDGHASAEVLMLSMRDYYGKLIAGSTTLDNIPDTPVDGGITDTDFLMTLDLLYKRIGDKKAIEIFKRYFLENETNIRALSIEFQMDLRNVRRLIDITRDMAKEVFAVNLPQSSIPNTEKSHAAHDRDVIDVEDLFDFDM